MKYFHQLISYYIIDYNYYNNTNNIRRNVVGYIMSMKRKQRTKLKARSPEQDTYHLMFNNMLPSDSDLLCTNTHKGCCLLKANEYNCKLRSVIGQEDESKVTKWTWFNKQVCDTLLCSWIISRKLVDGTNIRRAIGRLFDLVYTPSAGMRNSVGPTTSFFHASMVIHPGSNDHFIKIMNPESTEKTSPRLAVTKTTRAAFIHRINMTQKLTRVRKILLTPTRILTRILTQ